LANKTLALLVAQRTTLLFVTGFAVAYTGAAALSPPIANLGSGVLMMTLAVWPYLTRAR
jgi:hypothetical protein